MDRCNEWWQRKAQNQPEWRRSVSKIGRRSWGNHGSSRRKETQKYYQSSSGQQYVQYRNQGTSDSDLGWQSSTRGFQHSRKYPEGGTSSHRCLTRKKPNAGRSGPKRSLHGSSSKSHNPRIGAIPALRNRTHGSNFATSSK